MATCEEFFQGSTMQPGLNQPYGFIYYLFLWVKDNGGVHDARSDGEPNHQNPPLSKLIYL